MTGKSLGYYFLNKRLYPPVHKDYRPDLLIFLVNQNKGPHYNKVLLVQQGNYFWSIPKEGIKSPAIVDDFFVSLTRNLQEELGLHGTKVLEHQSQFELRTILFDFDTQVYDKERSEDEQLKSRPSKGKIYHLVILFYKGSDKLPLSDPTNSQEVRDYRWVDLSDGLKLLDSNNQLIGKAGKRSPHTISFNLKLWQKSWDACILTEQLKTEIKTGQKVLF